MAAADLVRGQIRRRSHHYSSSCDRVLQIFDSIRKSVTANTTPHPQHSTDPVFNSTHPNPTPTHAAHDTATFHASVSAFLASELRSVPPPPPVPKVRSLPPSLPPVTLPRTPRSPLRGGADLAAEHAVFGGSRVAALPVDLPVRAGGSGRSGGPPAPSAAGGFVSHCEMAAPPSVAGPASGCCVGC